MNINLIDFSAVVDMAFVTMMKHEKTYSKMVDGRIYVPNPGEEVKKCFARCMEAHMKEKFSPFDSNFLVMSCRPCDNWRLKHVGKRYSNMISPNRFSVKNEMMVGIGPLWEGYLSGYFEKCGFKKISLPDVDYDDIYDVASISDVVTNVKKYDPVCICDANRMIARSDEVQIPKFVMSEVSKAFTEENLV